MSKYTLGGGKTAHTGSTYARALIILGILAMGLLIYDVAQFHSLMVYVFTGVKL